MELSIDQLLLTEKATSTHRWSVTPCSLRSCTRRLVAKTSLLNSSSMRTFHTSGPAGASSNAAGECGRGYGSVDELEVGGGWFKLRSVRRAWVCDCSNAGRDIST
jgi:hypothetical protein